MTDSRRTTLTAHLLLIATTFVWGSTFTLVKSALKDASPLAFNTVRMVLAFAVLAAVNFRSLRGLTRRQVSLGAATGTFLCLGYQLQTTGLARTTPSRSAFITGLVVVLVPLIGALPGVHRKGTPRPGVMSFGGALIAFAGLVLLTTPGNSRNALFSGFGLGEALSLGCAIAFAAHLLMLAHSAPHLDARRLGTLQIGFCALLMLLTLPLGGRPEFHLTPRLGLALGMTAVLGTAAAFTIQSWAQQHLPASHTALIFTLEPVFAWLTSLLFYAERLGTQALIGAGLILGGILLAELAPFGGQPHPQSLVS